MRRASLIALVLSLLIASVGVSSPRAKWIADGTPVCIAPGHQSYPRIVSDGNDGALILWGNDDFGIHVQRIGPDGISHLTPEGVMLPGQGYGHQMISDGAGGAIMCMNAGRVYAARFDANGTTHWEYLSETTSEVYEPQIVADGQGGAIIVWSDGRSGASDIYAQRLAPDLTRMWASGGVAVCTATSSQEDAQIVADGAGGAIIVWEDSRSGSGDVDDVYAQRISSNGVPLWAVDGVSVCVADNGQYNPHIVADGSGGAIITWDDSRGDDTDVYAQHVDADGAVMWDADGIPISDEVGSQSHQRIASDGLGGAVITWEDKRRLSESDIYAQRVDGDGVTQWASDGIGFSTADDFQQEPRIIYSGSGGVIIAWYHGYDSGERQAGDIYVQRATLGGTLLWDTDGTAVCTAAGTQSSQQLISDGHGGAIVVWRDWRAGAEDSDIYAARVDQNGPMPVMLRSWSVDVVESVVEISWQLSLESSEAAFSVLRIEGGIFRPIDSVGVDLAGSSYMMRDESCEPGRTYVYRVMASTEASDFVLFQSKPVAIPVTTPMLHPASPNPFNPSTTIRFYLPEAVLATVGVYDLAGRLVRTIVSAEMRVGAHEAVWEGNDSLGRAVSSGTYVVSLRTGNRTLSRRVMLLK